jgi:glycosyltransferase involved in cell wall biosynthesis
MLFLARVERRKGVYLAVEAFELLKPLFPSVTLTIAGSGSELSHLRSLIKEKQLVDVTTPGYIRGRHKYEALAAADCYVFPTFDGEGMPISVLEAMAFGLPVVTRPVAGIGRAVEHGVEGLLIASLAAEDFAEATRQLIEDDSVRLRMGIAGMSRIRGRFAAEESIKFLECLCGL